MEECAISTTIGNCCHYDHEITSFSEVTTYLPAVNWSGVFSTGLTTPAPLSICHRLDPRKAPRHRERRGILKLVPAGSFTTWRHSTPVAGLLPLKAWSRCERWPDTPLLKSNIFPLRKNSAGQQVHKKIELWKGLAFSFSFFPPLATGKARKRIFVKMRFCWLTKRLFVILKSFWCNTTFRFFTQTASFHFRITTTKKKKSFEQIPREEPNMMKIDLKQVECEYSVPFSCREKWTRSSSESSKLNYIQTLYFKVLVVFTKFYLYCAT